MKRISIKSQPFITILSKNLYLFPVEVFIDIGRKIFRSSGFNCSQRLESFADGRFKLGNFTFLFHRKSIKSIYKKNNEFQG